MMFNQPFKGSVFSARNVGLRDARRFCTVPLIVRSFTAVCRKCSAPVVRACGGFVSGGQPCVARGRMSSGAAGMAAPFQFTGASRGSRGTAKHQAGEQTPARCSALNSIPAVRSTASTENFQHAEIRLTVGGDGRLSDRTRGDLPACGLISYQSIGRTLEQDASDLPQEIATHEAARP
jgi:hypothetical protein